MATGYHAYGATLEAFLTAVGTVSGTQVYKPAGSQTITVWTAQTGGTQVTDLMNASQVAVTSLTTDANGRIGLFYAPTSVAEVWLDGGAGRSRATSVDHGFVHTVATKSPDDSGDVTLVPADVGAAAAVHNHDDRYYTETEIDGMLAGAGAPTLANLPAGSGNWVYYDGATWPARPTARTDITVIWVGGTDATPPTAQVSGVDLWLRPAAGA